MTCKRISGPRSSSCTIRIPPGSRRWVVVRQFKPASASASSCVFLAMAVSSSCTSPIQLFPLRAPISRKWFCILQRQPWYQPLHVTSPCNHLLSRTTMINTIILLLNRSLLLPPIHHPCYQQQHQEKEGAEHNAYYRCNHRLLCPCRPMSVFVSRQTASVAERVGQDGSLRRGDRGGEGRGLVEDGD